ncbi:MAG TPA: hypothetical protein VKV73_31870 [Chloroflexota bacterium]|nr:hypothetical protein [Chloroflexota bacterium]
MATLAVPPRDPVVAAPTTHQQLGASAEVDASIMAYLGAGDQMAMIMGVTMIVCGALIVLLVAAWAFRILPGAI